MKYVSTRKGFEATAPETVFQGLAPDGGLYVPVLGNGEPGTGNGELGTLGGAERFVLDSLFGDFPRDVREQAVERLLTRFPAEDPVPLVEKDGLHILELFHGRTGAFKDVALSMLPVFLRHSANGRRVLILTATSGDTGSAAMQGFAGVDGTEIIVFYPATGTSKIQRLQMTTPADANVHAVGSHLSCQADTHTGQFRSFPPVRQLKWPIQGKNLNILHAESNMHHLSKYCS